MVCDAFVDGVKQVAAEPGLVVKAARELRIEEPSAPCESAFRYNRLPVVQ